MQNRWFKFIFLFLGAFAISISQLKLSPTVVAKGISELLGLDVESAEIQWLSSIFSVSGIFLAMIGGFVMSKIGTKKLTIILLLCLVLGNFLGYLVIDNYVLLLITRVIEGIAFSMYLMVAMIYIRHWFADSGSGTAIGVFGTYSAFASMIILNIAVPIVDFSGFRSIWLYLGVFAFLNLLIVIFVFDDVETEKKEKSISSNYLKQALSNKSLWLLALAFGCMAFVLFTFLLVSPLFLKGFYELKDVQANGYSSVFGLAGIPTGILAGVLIDALKKPVLVGIIGFIFMVISCFISVYLQNSAWYFVPYLFVFSGAISFCYTAIMNLTSSLSDKPEITGYDISLVNTVYYTVIVFGAPLTMTIVQKSGWNLGFLMLGSLAVIGLISIIVFNYVQKLETKKNKYEL